MKKRIVLLFLFPTITLTTVISIAIFSLYYALITYSKPFPGFFVTRDGSISSIVRRAWKLDTKKIKPFQRVISINNTPIRNGYEFKNILWKLKEKDKVTVTITHKKTKQSVSIILKRLSLSDFAITFVFPYMIGLLYFIIGHIVFFARRNYTSILFLATCIPLALFYITTFDYVTTYKFARLWICYPIFAALSIHFFIIFPFVKKTLHKLWILSLNYLLSLIIIILRELALGYYKLNRSIITLTAVYMAMAWFIDILILIYSWYKSSIPWFRSKAQISLFALFLTATTAVVWVLSGGYTLPFFNFERAMILSAIFPLLMGYVIIKANIFDISSALRLSISYIIATGFLFIIYFITVAATSLFVQTYITIIPRTPTVAIISTLIVATLFHPIRIKIQKMVDNLFFKDKEKAKEIVLKLTEKLGNFSSEPQGFFKFMGETIQEIFQVKKVAIYTKGTIPNKLIPVFSYPEESLSLPVIDSNQLSKIKITEPIFIEQLQLKDSPWIKETPIKEMELLLPIISDKEIIGIIFLGSKKKGKYRIGDLELLELLRNTSTLVIQYINLLQEVAQKEKLALLGQFSSMMIHEIKNPLGIINISLGGLKRRMNNDLRGTKLLSLITEEIERMNMTISKVLNFIKPQVPQVKLVEVEAVVRNVLKGLTLIINKKEIGISIVSTDYPNRIYVDPDHLYHILFNIILNGIEAVAKGGIIECRIYPDNKGNIVIEVRDNGPGIPQELRLKIFTPFFSTKKEGTGLGLAIVDQLTKLNKGEIVIEDNKPNGTIFKLIFPGANRLESFNNYVEKVEKQSP